MAEGRNPSARVVVVILVLIIAMPQMAAAIKLPRINMSPRAKKQLKEFLKDHASDIPDLIQVFVNSSSDDGSGNGGGRSGQAAATNAGSYILSFHMGTPPQRVSGMLDINSEHVWTQCACRYCNTARQDGATLFYPKKSSTMDVEKCDSSACKRFSSSDSETCVSDDDDEPCSFTDAYVGNTTGVLATDMFRFDDGGDPAVVTFGCGMAVETDDLFAGVSGVIGLGRGRSSLVSQVGDGRFSYYFAPDGSNSDSFVRFGDDARPTTKKTSTTDLLQSDAYPDFYLVGLTGVRVDGQDLPIPDGTFGSGGVILSISIPLTFLDERAYSLLKQALVRKIGSPAAGSGGLGLGLCYESPVKTVPAMALVFDGGVVMELETWNYFYLDADTGLECLTIVPSKAGGPSLLGNLIQEGTHMIYDVQGSKLQFEPLDSSPKGSEYASSSQAGSPPMSLLLASFALVLPVMYYVLY